jgi:hypothetical protein
VLALRALEVSVKEMSALTDAVNGRFKAVEDALCASNIGISKWVRAGHVRSTYYDFGFDYIENQWRILVREAVQSPVAEAAGAESPATPP